MTAEQGPATAWGIRRVWHDGDAVLLVDPRLPVPTRNAMLAAMGALEPVEPGDALVVVTSGTTGEPRGVVLTFEAVLAAALASSARLELDPERDCWLSTLPLAHIGGLSVITRCHATHTRFTFDAGDPEATLVSAVPTQVQRGDVDPARFRRVLLGGSADWRAGERPDNVVHTYGLTETAGGVVYDGVPLDGVEVRVDDADAQIHVRGPMLLRCYRDGTDPKTADGWLPTGDAGRLDADGRLHVDGRIGDVIVTGGEKVWPDAVEKALRRHPAVADVAVAGAPDDEWGTRVVAYVVPTTSSAPPTLDDLRAAAKETLPAYAAPKECVLLESLPRTAIGKIQRAALRPYE